jgi:NAD(P)-dependent dehydrogenase (short-subunit alcohol dehydrogenase family)
VRNKKATQERLAADGVTNAHILTSDITDEQGLRLAAEEAGKILRDRGLDVLINNAAYVSDLTALKSLQDLYVATYNTTAMGTVKADARQVNRTRRE